MNKDASEAYMIFTSLELTPFVTWQIFEKNLKGFNSNCLLEALSNGGHPLSFDKHISFWRDFAGNREKISFNRSISSLPSSPSASTMEDLLPLRFCVIYSDKKGVQLLIKDQSKDEL